MPALQLAHLPTHNRQLPEAGSGVHQFDGEVAIHDVKRPVEYTLTIPEDLRSDVLAVGVNGLAATKPTLDRFMGALANRHGIMTLHFDPARAVGSKLDVRRSLLDPQQLHHNVLEGVIGHVQSNIGVAKLPNGSQAMNARLALLLYSMGELAGTSFALDNPESVDAIVHIGGVGIEGRLGFELAKRTGKMALLDVVPGLVTGGFGFHPNTAKRSGRYFFTNPPQVVGEIVSCMTADTRPRIKQLRTHGIYQAFVGFKHDQYFPPENSLAEIDDDMDHSVTLDNCPHTGPVVRPFYTAKHVGQILLERPTRL